MTTNKNVTERHVTRNVTGSVQGALIRLSNDGLTATVLERDSGLLVRVATSTLTPSRGRPVKLVKGLCRADVNELIRDDGDFVHDAIVELFGRQLDSEREALATYADNDVGFRADDARRGSMLALKSVCAWDSADYSIARDVLSRYSGTQLFDVASERLSEREIVEATGGNNGPTETQTMISEILAMLTSN